MIEGQNLYAMKAIWKKRERDGDFLSTVVTQAEIDRYWESVNWQMAH